MPVVALQKGEHGGGGGGDGEGEYGGGGGGDCNVTTGVIVRRALVV